MYGKKYRAAIRIDGKFKSLGSSYDTAEQAAKARDKEAIKIRVPLSKLNFPKKAPVGYTPIQKALQSNNTVGQHHLVVNLNAMVVAQVNTNMPLLLETETQMVTMIVMYVY